MKGTDIYDEVCRFRAAHPRDQTFTIILNPKDFADIEEEMSHAPLITAYKNTLIYVRNRRIKKLEGLFGAKAFASTIVREGEIRIELSSSLGI